jgi:hypothetical protein
MRSIQIGPQVNTNAFAIKYGFPGLRFISVGLTVVLVSAAAGLIPGDYALAAMGKIAQVKSGLPSSYAFYLLALCVVLIMEPMLWLKKHLKARSARECSLIA